MITLNDLMDVSVLQGVDAFVFDCDGVLIDSYNANTVYYNFLREHFGLGPMDQAQEEFVHIHPMKESIEHIVPADIFPAALEYQRNFDYSRMMPYLTRMDGLIECLEWIRGAGFPMAVNTSRTDTMEMVLEHMEMEGFFFPVVTSAKVRNPKPAPESMHLVMSKLDLDPRRTVLIGDSIVDEKTAKAAGCRFWAYDNDRLDGEVMIPDYWTFKRCLQKAYPNAPKAY